MQDDWDAILGDLDDVDFSGKTVAYFGTGDQIGYADNFQDAMGILEEKIAGLGGKTVGYWSAEGYDHSESKAIRDGKFCGLALDDDNESDKKRRPYQDLVRSDQVGNGALAVLVFCAKSIAT